MNGVELLTLTGEDQPDDVYTGGIAEYERNLPSLTYEGNPAIEWVKKNPLIVAGVIVATIIIYKKMKKR